jgi:two-component sensor histidine kinase
MSAVHEHLYRLDQFSEVNAETLVPGIVEPLRQGFDHPVVVTYDVDPIALDRDHATPLALLINEVVTNALKYAFPDRGGGNIHIALNLTNGRELVLIVSDNGVGFDATLPSNGLGSRLIPAMVAQLNGSWSYQIDHGTRFEAKIPLNANHGATGASAAA